MRIMPLNFHILIRHLEDSKAGESSLKSADVTFPRSNLHADASPLRFTGLKRKRRGETRLTLQHEHGPVAGDPDCEQH